MAHGSGVISSPTGDAQRGDNGNNATGRRNGEGKRNRHAPRPGGCGATERGGGNGMLSSPADAAQQEPRNEGGATRTAQRGQPGGSSP